MQEPSTNTQEISAAQVRAQTAPCPQGAAAAAQPPKIPLAPMKRVQARFNPLADGMVYLVVFLGGMLGAGMRYALSLVMPAAAAPQGFWHSFHLPTFTANMLACFIFACLTSYISQASWIRKRVRQLTSRGIGMGMCGGFSTLSALAIEELTTLQASRIAGAVFYLLTSFACGLLVAYIGARLGLLFAARKTARVANNALRRSQQQGERSGRHVTAGETVVAEVNEAPPAYEPAPITDEIPLTGDLTTGEAH
jgi:CrcB protein